MEMSAYTDMIDLYTSEIGRVHALLKADKYEEAEKHFIDTMTMFEAEPAPTDTDSLSEEEWSARGQKLAHCQAEYRRAVEALQTWTEVHKIT
jgi:hypothetical protein